MNMHTTTRTKTMLHAHRGIVMLLALNFVVTMLLLHPHVAAAAPLLDLGSKIDAITEKLKLLGRGVFILALSFAFLVVIGSPVLPEVARENKGKAALACLGAMGLGMVPDIADIFFA